MNLDGARVLITGGSRGIGEATARELSRRGARLALVAREGPELERAADLLDATAIAADLSDPAVVDHVVREAQAALGQIDVLINNAAMVRPAAVTKQDDDDLQAQMQCNLLAPMRLVHRLLPGMLERNAGHIVNVASGAAALPLANMTNYCASKAGLVHYTASLRSEIWHTPVGTTVVELGTVRGTRAYNDALSDERLRQLYTRLQRLRLMRDTPAHEVAQHIAAAIERNRPHVRVPTAARPGWALNSAVRDATHYLFRTPPSA